MNGTLSFCKCWFECLGHPDVVMTSYLLYGNLFELFALCNGDPMLKHPLAPESPGETFTTFFRAL